MYVTLYVYLYVLVCLFTSLRPHITLHYSTKTTTDTWYLWRLFGWTAPLACYAFFLVAVACNALLVRPLIPLVYIQARPFSFCSGSVSTFISHNRLKLTHMLSQQHIPQERREGHFRYLHACVRHQLEAIALYRGLSLEGRRADEARV